MKKSGVKEHNRLVLQSVMPAGLVGEDNDEDDHG